MTNPLRRLGEMLATFVGRALGGAFFLLGKARGRKALHPRGEVLQGLIGRHGAVGRTGVAWLDEAGTGRHGAVGRTGVAWLDEAGTSRHGAVGRTGVAWLDEAGIDHVAVRLSRSLGLPAPRPDILGMALRIPTEPGQFGDVLLATTGTGLFGRYVLLPTRRHGRRAYTSLFPYKTVAGPLLLAAIPTPGSRRQYELAYARPTGPWLPFGTLEITQTTYRGHDRDLSFDPVLNVVPGLETYDWAAQLRRFSYAASRRAREHRHGF